MLLSNKCSDLNSKSFTVQKRRIRSILGLGMWFDCYRIQNRMNLATYTDLGTRLGPLYDRFILFYILVISQTQIGGRSKGMRLETGDSSGGSSYPASRNGDEGEKDEIDGSIRMVEDYQRYHCHWCT